MSTSLVQPSAALAALVGEQPMARAKVTQRVWAHIERHSLRQRGGRARWILLDDALRAALCTTRDEIAMYHLGELLDKQLTPAPIGAAPKRDTVKTKAKRNGKKMTVTAETDVSVTEKRFLPDAPPLEPPARIRIRCGNVMPAPGLNTRRHFDEADLRSLAESMRTMGQQQAVVLHDTGEPIKHLVAGERRYRAAKLLGDDFELEATIKAYTPAELVQLMLIENFQRTDLRPVEEARALQKGLELPGMTQRKLGEIVGREQGTISNAVRLLKLPSSILDLIDDGKLAPTVARDALLPYMAVPEQYRTPFYEAAAAELATPQDPEDEDYEGDDTRDVIRGVALRLTRSLNFGGYGGNDAPAFSAQRHTKHCDCGGHEIDRGGWQGKVKRCWNTAWWDAEQKRAKADKKKREQRAAAKAESGTLPKAKEKIGDLPLVPEEAFRKVYGHYAVGRGYGSESAKYGEISDDGEFAWQRDDGRRVTQAFDLAAVDPASLIVVKSYYGNPRLVTTDVEGYTAARRAFEEAAYAAIAEQRKVRIQQDVFAAGNEPMDVDGLLRFALEVQQDDIEELAVELGIIEEGEDHELDARELRLVLDVGARRDPEKVQLVEDVIRAELAESYAEKLRNLIPWETIQDDADEDVDEPDDEPADDEAEELAGTAS